MDVAIEPSWKNLLGKEFEELYFKTLAEFVRGEYAKDIRSVYPPPKLIFHAFNLCSFDDTRVVILGQDPYHGHGQAHGLSFSVPEGITPPPSLKNIFKEIHDDLGLPIPKAGNLEYLAKQGVLLLNATLTVFAHSPLSHHGKGWETFTDAVIQKLSEEKEGLVFLLWGRSAKEKGLVINREKHLVLLAAPPSPFSAHSGFFGCRHFSKTNSYLESLGKKPIRWTPDNHISGLSS